MRSEKLLLLSIANYLVRKLILCYYAYKIVVFELLFMEKLIFLTEIKIELK